VLLTDLFPLAGPVLVSGITQDSRLVRPGDLYVALPGRRHHGAEFAAQAMAGGAPAVLTDVAGAQLAGPLGVPLVVVTDPRREMAGVAAAIFDRPAEAMTMYAVTGTNGKTTTTFLLDAALRAAGLRTGMIGTIGFFLDGRPLEATRTTVTTPESTELQALLGYLRERGTQAVAMEVSSHALALGRVDAIPFAVAAFTNLGRDHLDFHGDEEAYFAAKASLFTPDRSRHAVVNIDDPRGRVLADRLAAEGRQLTTVSLTGPADCQALTCDLRDDGRTGVRARLRDRIVEFTLSLPGEFNVRNAVTALAMVAASGGDLDAAARGLGDASVPGRMQRVDLGPRGPVVYVDFAHTPQAVAAALQAVGPRRRRIAVLGSGGDRDPEKRRPMGAAAANHADLVLVTDDNPRSEDPAAIRAEVLAGARAAMSAGGRASEVLDAGDRRSAIRQALSRARPGEVIAILGKGHELGQEVAGEVFPFSDAEVAAAEWAARVE
jgi:UDP-N-acetylmuramoyl-L-alanyl-D-glutamate--2,6-diaminopimelate ligase